MQGLSILQEHALIHYDKARKSVTIRQKGNAEILVNGDLIGGKTELQQNDRYINFELNYLWTYILSIVL